MTPLRKLLFRVLRAPEDPPPVPLGSPGSAQVFRASPQLLKLKALGMAAFGLFLLLPEAIGIAVAVMARETAAVMALSTVAALAFAFVAAAWFLVRLDYDMRYYVVTDRSLRIREGALVIRESTFTFANVQNVSVQQGPLDRLFGVSSVRIETAGGGGRPDKDQPFVSHRGELGGIENAEEVRDRILALLKAYRDAGLGDREPHQKSATSFAGMSGTALTRLSEVRDAMRRLRQLV